MRRTLVVLTLVASLGALTACSPSGSDEPAPDSSSASDTCTPTAPGDLSDAVTITGEFGQKPTVAFTAPITAEKTQRTVVSEGDGVQVQEGDTVVIDFTLYNGTSGAVVEGASTGYDVDSTAQFVMDDSTYLPGFVHTIQCSTEGSRVVGVVPPSDLWGEAGQAQLGIAGTDTVVFVADIHSTVKDRADGADQPAPDGFPAVTLAEDGEPSIEIPDSDPPAAVEIGVLKKGEGAIVQESGSVDIQYKGWNWRTKESFDKSWGKADRKPFPVAGFVPGFTQALIGQTVGSQVIVIIPPDQGYGAAGNSGAGIEGTDTLVFVIDILATS